MTKKHERIFCSGKRPDKGGGYLFYFLIIFVHPPLTRKGKKGKKIDNELPLHLNRKECELYVSIFTQQKQNFKIEIQSNKMRCNVENMESSNRVLKS